MLNEVVIAHENGSYLVDLDCFVNDRCITRVHADGLIIATPTGSTAYSMGAGESCAAGMVCPMLDICVGGSIVHPQTKAILMTPICPHTLSFRPMLFPDSVYLKIVVAASSRGNATITCDGKGTETLCVGDAIIVSSDVDVLLCY